MWQKIFTTQEDVRHHLFFAGDAASYVSTNMWKEPQNSFSLCLCGESPVSATGT